METFNPQEAHQLLLEIREFEKTSLYKHYRHNFQLLADSTKTLVVNDKMTGIQDLFNREAMMGEARAAETAVTWFTELKETLEQYLENQEDAR